MGARLSGQTLSVFSVELEDETGYDSIPTIWRSYSTNERGNFRCCFPGCTVTRAEPAALWRHIHFGKHGPSFGARSPELLRAERSSHDE